MPSPASLTPVAALRLAAALHEDGVALMRQRFRRDAPGAAPEAIEDKVRAWLATRPGAELGDAVDRPVPPPGA